MLLYLDPNTSACSLVLGSHQILKTVVWHKFTQRTQKNSVAHHRVGNNIFKERDKIFLAITEKEVPASVSIVTWHADCYHCFLYCSFTQRLARAPVLDGSISFRSTIVHEEVNIVFPDKLHFCLYPPIIQRQNPASLVGVYVRE